MVLWGTNGLARLRLRERLECEVRADPRVLEDLVSQLLVAERRHATVRVVKKDDLIGVHQSLRDHEAANGVLGRHPSGVADHVRIALLETEHLCWVESGVHAGEDGDPARGTRDTRSTRRSRLALGWCARCRRRDACLLVVRLRHRRRNLPPTHPAAQRRRIDCDATGGINR
jgi:hypothetical protein